MAKRLLKYIDVFNNWIRNEIVKMGKKTKNGMNFQMLRIDKTQPGMNKY